MIAMLTSAARVTTIFLLVVTASGQAAKSEESSKDARTSLRATRDGYSEVCFQIRRAAANNGLPESFFTRVIWQESRFDSAALSRAGAQGIAQFMPATASSRGLLNPFDPVDSLRESASYLRELNRTFGNLGLAAAAYNAGPGRLSRWMSGKRSLPQETISYVQIVTGQPITAWSSGAAKWDDEAMTNDIPCPAFADRAAAPDLAGQQDTPAESNWSPWGVQLSGSWTPGQVLANYEKLRRAHLAVLGDKDPMIVVTYGPSGMTKRFLVRVGADTRAEAELLCAKLQRDRLACFAVRNPTEQEALAKAQRYARLLSYARRPLPSTVEGTTRSMSSPKRRLAHR